MKLFDLIENGKHKILAEIDGERFEAHLIDVETREDLGEINAFVEKATEAGSKLSFLDNGAGGIKIIKDEEGLNVGVTCVDEEGYTHTFIPNGGDLTPSEPLPSETEEVVEDEPEEELEVKATAEEAEAEESTEEAVEK